MAGKFTEKMQQWMVGRNGSDDCGRWCLWASIICIVISFVLGLVGVGLQGLFSWLALGLIIYSYFRMMSKNIAKRQQENQKWVAKWSRVSVPFSHARSYMRDWKRYHKDYKLYRCSSCGQTLRVPKGKGKVKVTCPKCKTSFVKKS